MKHTVAALSLIVCCGLVPVTAQPSASKLDPRAEEIRAKHQREEKLTMEEEDYAQSAMERSNQLQSVERNKAWAAEHPARNSTGMIPLSELGRGKYKGEEGGLYPGGSNQRPSEHENAGLRLARSIRPLDAQGNPSNDGKIVLLTIGMSNTQQESRRWRIRAVKEPGINPQLAIVNGAMGAQTAHLIANASAPYWKLPLQRLQQEGLTAAQVQVVWVKEANAQPTEPFPAEAKKIQADLVGVMHILHQTFPNLKMAYISDRIYAGYAVSPLNPEPHSYETGFGVKWLIADQIAGKPELNYDVAKGPVQAPWLSWGPDLWADGMKPRKDGLMYVREDLAPDGTHPGAGAKEKVVDQLMKFFKTDVTTRSWFASK